MIKQKPVVALCGNTKDMEHYFEAYRILTEQGYDVLFPSVYHNDVKNEEYSEEVSLKVALHFAQIEKADQLYVINNGETIDGYTACCINYAKELGKLIIGKNEISTEEIEKIVEMANLELNGNDNVAEIVDEHETTKESQDEFVNNMIWFAGLIWELTHIKGNQKLSISIEEYVKTGEFKKSIELIRTWLNGNGMGFLREKMEDADLGRYLRVNRRMKRDWKSNEYLHEKIKFNRLFTDIDVLGKELDLNQLYFMVQTKWIRHYDGQRDRELPGWKSAFERLLKKLQIDDTWFTGNSPHIVCNTMDLQKYYSDLEVKEILGSDGLSRIEITKVNRLEKEKYIHSSKSERIFEKAKGISSQYLDNGKSGKIDYFTAVNLIEWLCLLLPMVEKVGTKKGVWKALEYDEYKRRKNIIRNKVKDFYYTHRADANFEAFEGYKAYFYEHGKAYSEWVMDSSFDQRKEITDKRFFQSLEFLEEELLKKFAEDLSDEIDTYYERNKMVLGKELKRYLEIIKDKIDDPEFVLSENGGVRFEDEIKSHEEYYEYICQYAYQKVFVEGVFRKKLLCNVSELNSDNEQVLVEDSQGEDNLTTEFISDVDIKGQLTETILSLTKKISASEEIKKYKELLDAGVITEEKHREKLNLLIQTLEATL